MGDIAREDIIADAMTEIGERVHEDGDPVSEAWRREFAEAVVGRIADDYLGAVDALARLADLTDGLPFKETDTHAKLIERAIRLAHQQWGAVEAERKRMRAVLLDYAAGHSQGATDLMLRALDAVDRFGGR